ncbi:MAG: o-succinylbenzoate synthase [Bacteroidetes bacterium]|nr:o-succinylbenzoate synthase [Bacteroidota bacterium]
MRIDRIELIHVKLVLVSPFVTSMGVELDEEHIIIRVDGEGVTGWGESVAEGTPFYSYETVSTAWPVLSGFLIPWTLGKTFSSVGDAIQSWEKVRGHRMAKAGLEAALWDLFAKAEGRSLASLLGGKKDRVDVGVSIGIQDSVPHLLSKVDGYLKEGYQRIKIKIAPGQDLDLVKGIRKEFPDIRLQVDANSAYSLADIPLFKAMDDDRLILIEQPLGYDDIYFHSKLQKELRTPVCLDESIHSEADTLAALELDSCRIINIKPGRVGGFSESKKIHDLCLSRNVPVWCGGMLESGIGRAGNVALASLPGFTLPGDISASKKYYAFDIVDPEFTVNPDGTMTVPTGPGIGVEVNMKNLDRVTVTRQYFTA